MKANYVILILSGLILSISSCKTIYQCGQPNPGKNLLVSKRVKAVIYERDSLCNTLDVER
jgi:hypothetical protein